MRFGIAHPESDEPVLWGLPKIFSEKASSLPCGQTTKLRKHPRSVARCAAQFFQFPKSRQTLRHMLGSPKASSFSPIQITQAVARASIQKEAPKCNFWCRPGDQLRFEQAGLA